MCEKMYRSRKIKIAYKLTSLQLNVQYLLTSMRTQRNLSQMLQNILVYSDAW